MIPVLPARLDWPSAIGSFLLNFGTLDWHVFNFLGNHIPPDSFAKIRSEHFHDRINRMKKVVEAGFFSTDQRQAFDRFFARLQPIRELRNRIAHGYLLVRIQDVNSTPMLTLSLPKHIDQSADPETRHLEFEELTMALSEVAALLVDFQKLTDDWTTTVV